jgi:pyruvate dehydrogenase E2 component (dihydrolipoamide acetyltransferase)
MTTEFKLPPISEGVDAADIAAVHVHEGDVIQSGQVVFEVETEKAVAEIPSPQAGRIEKILVKPGQKVKIGEVLLTIDESAAADGAKGTSEGTGTKAPAKEAADAGTSAPAKAAPASAKQQSAQGEAAKTESEPQTKATSKKEEAPQPQKPAATKPSTTSEMEQSSEPGSKAESSTPGVAARSRVDDNGHELAPVPAGPATRRLARELGVDLHRVTGSGPGGRITTDDVQAFVRTLTTGRVLDVTGQMASPSLPPFDRFGPTERRPMNKLARVTASNLSIAWQTVPHVTQHDLADVTDLEEARQSYMKSIGQN